MLFVILLHYNFNLITSLFSFVANLNIIKLLQYRIEERQNITSSYCEWSNDYELSNMCIQG